MLKKLTISVLLIFTFGDISGYGATGNMVDEDSMCDFDTFGSADGSFDLQANWTPNKINVHFHDDANGTVTTKTCTYNEIFDLPAKPTRTGYTFAGWRIYDKTCGIGKLSDAQRALRGNTYYGYNFAEYQDSNSKCYGFGGGSQSCSLQPFKGLSDGEWKTEFDYGTVYGQASCNNQTFKNQYPWEDGVYTLYDGNMEPSDKFSKSANGEWCWCRITGFTQKLENGKNDEQCKTTSSKWVFQDSINTATAEDCASNCAFYCAYYTQRYQSFRNVLFDAMK